MSAGGGGFFNPFGGNDPERRLHQHQGPGGGHRGVSFEDAAEYDLAVDDRDCYGHGFC